MKLGKSKNYDVNYLAKIVDIKTFQPHKDPEVTKMKCCLVDGFNIVVGINEKPGKFVYFPVMSQINEDLLRYANLFRHSGKNNDASKSGFFEDNGRVKPIKLRGQVSDGFLLGLDIFKSWLLDSVNKEPDNMDPGIEFDEVSEGLKHFWVCKKYYPADYRVGTGKAKTWRHVRVKDCWDKIIPSQFRFHYQTLLLRKCPSVIHPNDIIHISAKVNGTSGVSANVLCKKKLTWRDKLAKFICGNDNIGLIYDNVYSSRTVIKNQYYNPGQQKDGGFYGVDVWKYANDVLKPFLSKGMTMYYEIVGYLPNGAYVQKDYDYGMVPPKDKDHYEYGVNFDIQIYRVTLTNTDGVVHEFSPHEVQVWCKNNGLHPVEEYYYGYARDLYPQLDESKTDWCQQFLEKLANEDKFFMEKMSPTCKNKVPHEGIVIKIDNLESAAFKLKCFAYLNAREKRLSKGVHDMEDEN